MRVIAAPHLLAVVTFLLASCDRPAIERGQSLVGAKNLPSARVLSREIIQINTGFDALSPGMLSYELRPDNTLQVSLSFRENYAAKKFGPDIFHLPANVAAQARQKLWRLRPEQLRGLAYETYPTGCSSPPPDVSPDFSVAFIAEGPQPGAEGDRVGIFAEPRYSTCNNRRVLDANNLVGSVMESFPTSGVAAEYAHERGILFNKYGRSQPPNPRKP